MSSGLPSLVQFLGSCALTRSLTPEELERVALTLRPKSLAHDEVVCRQGEQAHSLFIVFRGRLTVQTAPVTGRTRTLGELGPGDHFGELALLGDGRRTATVSCRGEAVVLELPRHLFEALLDGSPRFAADLGRALGLRLVTSNENRRSGQRRRSIALLHIDSASRALVGQLRSRLGKLGHRTELVTESGSPRSAVEGLQTLDRLRESEWSALLEEIKARSRAEGRLLFVDLDGDLAQAAPLAMTCEETWLVFDARSPSQVWEPRLRAWLRAAPAELPGVRVLWRLPEGRCVPPLLPADLRGRIQTLKAGWSDSGDTATRLQLADRERLVRRVLGLQVGLALSGGGARGFAHFGALKVFEEQGLVFDRLAGTSFGALVGLGVAIGDSWDFERDYITRCVELSPWLASLPGGRHFHMWKMARSGRWTEHLKSWYADWHLDQLRTPLSTVAIDLLSGVQVVRDHGPVVEALLETVNLPLFRQPIWREGMALVDGGVVNNLPADVLVEHGCDFIVGIDVMARLDPHYGGVREGSTKAPSALPLETMMRVHDVQQHHLARSRQQLLDVRIAPDVGRFDMTEFHRRDAIVEEGERATRACVDELKGCIEALQSAGALEGRGPLR